MLCKVYTPYEFKVEKARGIEIFTDKGVFLDTYSGIGVLALGHSNPEVLTAMKKKLERYTHLSNYFLDEDAEEVAARLVGLSGQVGEVFFTNSGTEATEAALKAIKKLRKGKIVSFVGNFHGRTIGALSLTYGKAIREPFEPLLTERVFLKPDPEKFTSFARENQIAGVFIECIQGNSGVLPLSEELLETISQYQREQGFILVADEIQSGLGRTGKAFAYQHFGLKPDIITVGKALGGGLPLGAALFSGFSPFKFGEHGSTFAPNPVALAAGKIVLSKLDEDFLMQVQEKGKYFREKLAELPWVQSVNGYGLMIGVTTENASKVKAEAYNRGVLLNIAGGRIRFLPALNITIDEIDEIISRLSFEGF